MDLNLQCEMFEDNIFGKIISPISAQYIFRFDNNYGASVVKHKYSLGGEQNLWELYPVIFTGEHHWVLVNDDDDIKTIIPHKSVGCLNNSKVLNLLEKIKNFKKEKI